MSKTYSTSEVAKILGVSNSKLYYAIREMSLEIDTDHRGDRLFTDDDIALLKQAFSIVASGGTYKQAYSYLVQGEIIEVDHTPPKQFNEQFNEQNLKEFIQVITKELAKSNQDMQEQTIKAISENTQSYKDNTKQMQELKDEIKNLKAEIEELKSQEPENKGLLARLFGK
jgi:DNA-binding transcriptional MerR regulator